MLGLLTFNRVVDLYHEKHNSGLPLRLEYNTVFINPLTTGIEPFVPPVLEMACF